ncbi:hypothetical protein WJX81_001125 [Elliptochloris bilobata]|uniref:Radical SAM core domain-containing protein n=1 Tax=Elliptochloris bilobata TaxID=381761 RepID=A0AAW1S762_9CHLO
MAKKRRLCPQSVWDEEQLSAAFREAGVKDVHVRRLHRHLLRHPGAAWADVPALPKAAQAVLEQRFVRATSSLEACQRSADGTTTKLLVRLQDGLQVEAVIMTYSHPKDVGSAASSEAGADRGKGEGGHPQAGRQRHTLCVSSQVGCQMGCTFCATGTMGLVGDLTAGEILEQLVYALDVAHVRNVVFMGMGEPLNNWEPVKAAVRAMVDPTMFGLKRSKVTVSTVGVVPRIRALAAELPGVSLALSLHAPNQTLRQRIVPSARAYPLERLMAAVAEYQAVSGMRVFVEYVMLAGVNDASETAHELGALLTASGHKLLVNLIPWNPVFSPGMAFAAPDSGAVAAFGAILREQYGLFTTVRQEMGQDISGACGQLVIEHGGSGCSKDGRHTPTDIEELARRPAATPVA